MSIRRRKKQVVSHLFMTMLGRHLEAWLNTPDLPGIDLLNAAHLAHRAALTELVEPEVEECKVEYVVQKVTGGEVVATFDTREDALALVLKHARQKKAKLQVMDSATGELVLFAEEEMA